MVSWEVFPGSRAGSPDGRRVGFLIVVCLSRYSILINITFFMSNILPSLL